MRVLSQILVASALSLGLGLAPGCKNTGGAGGDTSAPDKPKRKAGMPKPYRVPAKPELAVYIATPAAAMTAAQAYVPGVLPNQRALLEQAISGSANELDKQLAGFVDLQRPWAAVMIDGQSIVWLPIVEGRHGTLSGLLAPKPPEGKFGAVNLQRTGAGPKLAWFDAKSGYIALADDLRGISTARTLPNALGKNGLSVAASAAQARRFTGQAPFSRIEVTGAGPNDFTLVIEDADTSEIPELAKFSEGALTGMLEAEHIAAGVSSKYKDHAKWTKKTLSDTKRQIDKQNFLIRGNLSDLNRRLGAVLRSWDGRFVTGMASKHLVLGFGSKDPGHMGQATHQLIRGVRDNISMARQFGFSVPKIVFNKSKLTAAGYNVAVVSLKGAKKVVPKQYWALIDDRGDLRIAMAFSKNAGAGFVVVGPTCDRVIKTWLEETKGATKGSSSAGDLAAATFAVTPAKLASLASGDINRVLGLNATGKPTKIVVSRDEARYEIRVKGPKITGATRAGPGSRVARPGAAGRRAQPTRSASGGRPARAPARTKSSRTKSAG